MAQHSDAARRLTFNVLDMGRERYGDCLLITLGNQSVLVDGGHRSDYEGQEASASIPDQLTDLLGPRPFKITALIVTHCHLDHIGCLPRMVEDGLLEPKWALVADEKLGFGRAARDSALPIDALPLEEQAIVAALREEDRSSMDDADLRRFLEDAEKLEDIYKKMLSTLKANGTKLVRFGRDDPAQIIAELSAFNFKILGPTDTHLAICAQAIAELTTDAADRVAKVRRQDATIPTVDLYRTLIASSAPIDALDRPGKGAALNNQSIVFKMSSGAKSALFAGDMQFAKAEIGGLNQHMANLREVVQREGPYEFMKLSHHTSYNGVDDSVLNDFGDPEFLVHTGGWNDAGHPDAAALETLKRRSRNIQLARTDRNGGISYTFSDGFEVSKGRLNDFTPNAGGDVIELAKEEASAGFSTGPGVPAGAQQNVVSQNKSTVDILFMRVPLENGRIVIGDIPIVFDVPRSGGGASIQTRPSDVSSLSRTSGTLASGRALPKLLFVTASSQLSKNIGETESRLVAKLVEDGDQELLDLRNADDARVAVRQRLSKGDIKGVVVVGGYDVVPSERVDVLDPALRKQIGAEAREEPDGFIVWSDDHFGDADGDGIAEIPVSRIPDGYSSELVIRCLTAGSPVQKGRYGIRNQERPFADQIWQTIAGNEAIICCGPHDYSKVIPSDMQRPAVYFMLHGDDRDATRFWGEDNGTVEALNLSNLPTSGIGTVFAGCCWGALTVSQIASRAGNMLGVRSPKQSMALSLLLSGANAFVGCTGAHYSPDAGEEFFGSPLHRSFWSELLLNQKTPSEALFLARKSYLRAMPHGLSKPYHLGIERKIYKQFTCLGLGW